MDRAHRTKERHGPYDRSRSTTSARRDGHGSGHGGDDREHLGPSEEYDHHFRASSTSQRTNRMPETRLQLYGRDDLGLAPVISNGVRRGAGAHSHSMSALDVVSSSEDVSRDEPRKKVPIRFLIDKREHSFTVLNGDHLPHIPGSPPRDTSGRRRMIDPEKLVGCFWAMNAIPYAGFVPVEPYRACFDDSLFGCIFEQKWDLPVEQTPEGNWSMSAGLIAKWEFLESVLCSLRDILLKVRGGVASKEHLPAPNPSCYMYHLPLNLPIIYRKRVLRSRYAFILLGAEISYLFAPLCDSMMRLRELLEDHFVDVTLVEDMLQSWMFRPSPGFNSSYHGGYGRMTVTSVPRFGMFVNAGTCTIAEGLLAYERFKVPLWFWWGNRSVTLSSSCPFLTRRYGFSREMVSSYLAMETRPLAELEAGLHFEKVLFKRGYAQHPQSKPIQIITKDSVFAAERFETWWDFFHRRHKTIIDFPIAPEDVAIIEERQRAADQGKFDTMSRLFRWKAVLDGRGVKRLSRRVVSSHLKATRVWGEFTPAQRVYCAEFDEWDVSEEFGRPLVQPEQQSVPVISVDLDRAIGDASHDTGVEFQTRFEDEQSPTNEGNVLPEELEPGELKEGTLPGMGDVNTKGRVDWKALYSTVFFDARPLEPRGITRVTFKEMLRCIYGLHIPSTALGPPDISGVEAQKQCQHRVGFQSSAVLDADILNPEGHLAIQEYLSRLQALGTDGGGQPNEPSVAVMTTGWCDLEASHESYVFRKLREGLRVDRVDFARRDDEVYELYWSGRESVRLLLYRAVDVIFYIRQLYVSDSREALRLLASLGIRFSLAVEAEGLPLQRPLASPKVPMRTHPFKPTLLDYRQYVAQRARLFTHSSVLRAALMSGGIVWRLAMEHCTDSSITLDGPSGRVEQIGQRSTLRDGTVLCEEVLTEEQINVICGVYKVYHRDKAELAPAHLSWFPKRGGWTASGFNVGLWTEDSEDWYQHRIKGYINEEKQPLKQSAWARSIRLNAEARKIAKGNEAVCRQKLDVYMSGHHVS